MALPVLEFPPYIGVDSVSYPTSLETENEDNAIRTDMQNGTEVVRPWSTKTRKTFTMEFTTRTLAEAKVLEDFYEQVKQFTPFTWTHPTDKNELGNFLQYGVRFAEPIKPKQDGKKPLVKDISIKLVEV